MGGAAQPGTSPMGAMPFQPQQMQLDPPYQEEDESEDEVQERDQVKELQKINIAKRLDDDELASIVNEAKRGYEADLGSMNDWLTANKEWSKLARQVKEKKTYPWPDASNIKYPLISTAALQFSARAYPSLVPADKKLVKTRIYGKDPTGQKRDKGNRIGTYMSWQLTEEMENWEEEMDKLLIMNAVVGQTYKKTYWDPLKEINVSCLIYSENFIIDYWTRDLQNSMRHSEIHLMTNQKIEELKLRDYFLDVDLGSPTANKGDGGKNESSVIDFTTPYTIIEQHTWLDLDDDGLREPYILWFHLESCKALRIQARFTAEGIKINDAEDVVGYKAIDYYTKFGFIPNPDGSFFDIGFGQLIGPINEAVNTNINQLTDSGHLQNLQGGWIAKGLRPNMADTTWKPGEWKSVNATGEDLKKGILPIPTKEPSETLFKLLGMLIQAGKELASVADIFTGKMPGQNTPATTTQATIEQGMKVFTAIYKRIYRSLDSEYKKLFRLNHTYLNPETYAAVLDEPIGPDDFDEDNYDICPTADPTATTQGEKMQKAQALMELLGTGLLDPMAIVTEYLQALEIPNWERFVPGMAETGQPMPPKPQPDPKLQAIEAKSKTDQMKAEKDMEVMDRKMALEQQSEMTKLMMKKEQHQQDMQAKRDIHVLDAKAKKQMSDIFAAEARTKAIHGVVEGRQKLSMNQEAHDQKITQAKEVSKSKLQSQNSKSGKKAK